MLPKSPSHVGLVMSSVDPRAARGPKFLGCILESLMDSPSVRIGSDWVICLMGWHRLVFRYGSGVLVGWKKGLSPWIHRRALFFPRPVVRTRNEGRGWCSAFLILAAAWLTARLDGRGTAALAAHGEATAGRHASVGRRHVPLVVRWAGVARLSSFTARRRRAGTTALAGIPMAWIWRNGAGKILSILSSSRCPSDRVRFGVCSWFAFLIWSRRSADLHQSGP